MKYKLFFFNLEYLITKNRSSVGLILHEEIFQSSYFLFQPVLHNWCNKGLGMRYPVCGMVHIKEPIC